MNAHACSDSGAAAAEWRRTGDGCLSQNKSSHHEISSISIWAALFRRKTRTVFTLLSVLAAFLLFGMLDAVRAAFDAPPSARASAGSIVSSRISIIQPLPQSLMPRIQAIPGVKDVGLRELVRRLLPGAEEPEPDVPARGQPDLSRCVSRARAAGGTAQGVRRDAHRRGHRRDRGEALQCKVGDKIPIKGSIFANKASGDTTWTFDIVGIFKAGEEKQRGLENQMLFRWDYFDEGRTFGGGTIGWYITRVNDPNESEKVAAAIDALSANSDHETKTQTEQAFNLAFVKQLGDIGLIVGAIMAAVFFTLILLTGNTMAQAVRERIPELAVLKTIGFSNKSVLGLVLAESVLLIVLGGVLGLVLAQVLLPAVNAGSGGRMNFPPIGGSTWTLGIVLMLGDRPRRRLPARVARHAPAHRRRTGRTLRRTHMKILINLLMLVVIVVAIGVLIYLPWPALLALAVLLAAWMALTRTGRQAWSVTKVGIATIPQRLGSSSVIIIGIAGVVGVLVALLAMAEGFRETLQQTGDAEPRSCCAAARPPSSAPASAATRSR